MSFIDNLRGRITAAFVLASLVFSVFVAGAAAFAVEYMEHAYAVNRLEENMAQMEAAALRGDAIRLPHSRSLTGFTYTRGGGIPSPEHTRGLAPGLIEYNDNGREMLALLRDVGDRRLILTFDMTELAALETLLEYVLLAGIAASVLISALLGLAMASLIVKPITELARAVDRVEDTDSVLPEPAGAPRDEVSALWRAFHHYGLRQREHMRREKQFTGDVSHELRHPLMAADNALELLSATAELDASASEQVSRARRALARMRTLIEIFLTLARAPDSVQRAHTARVDLTDLVTSAVEQFTPRARSRGLRLRVEGDPGATAGGDADMAAVVVGNLIDNAIKYTHGAEILVRVEQSGVSVVDSGPDNTASSHEPPVEVQAWLAGAQAGMPGAGLGLSIVERLCAHQGWTLQLTRAADSGTCARIDFGDGL